MLKLKLINETANLLRYEYYPEGKESSGYIIVEKGKCIKEFSKSENDEKGIYIRHALKRIREYISNSEYETQDIVAWY